MLCLLEVAICLLWGKHAQLRVSVEILAINMWETVEADVFWN
jgi:hypothetical protein